MLIDNAKHLRKNMTEAEKKLWFLLRRRQLNGLMFRRQAPIGNYIADFVCFNKKLIVELDGGQHADQKVYDEKRDGWLKNEGFKVLRYWNNQIMQEIENVKEDILRNLEEI